MLEREMVAMERQERLKRLNIQVEAAASTEDSRNHPDNRNSHKHNGGE